MMMRSGRVGLGIFPGSGIVLASKFKAERTKPDGDIAVPTARGEHSRKSQAVKDTGGLMVPAQCNGCCKQFTAAIARAR